MPPTPLPTMYHHAMASRPLLKIQSQYLPTYLKYLHTCLITYIPTYLHASQHVCWLSGGRPRPLRRFIHMWPAYPVYGPRRIPPSGATRYRFLLLTGRTVCSSPSPCYTRIVIDALTSIAFSLARQPLSASDGLLSGPNRLPPKNLQRLNLS